MPVAMFLQVFAGIVFLFCFAAFVGCVVLCLARLALAVVTNDMPVNIPLVLSLGFIKWLAMTGAFCWLAAMALLYASDYI